jgi:hypothetical protein
MGWAMQQYDPPSGSVPQCVRRPRVDSFMRAPHARVHRRPRRRQAARMLAKTAGNPAFQKILNHDSTRTLPQGMVWVLRVSRSPPNTRIFSAAVPPPKTHTSIAATGPVVSPTTGPFLLTRPAGHPWPRRPCPPSGGKPPGPPGLARRVDWPNQLTGLQDGGHLWRRPPGLRMRAPGPPRKNRHDADVLRAASHPALRA